MKTNKLLTGTFLVLLAFAIAVPVVAAESRFLAGAQRWFDRKCERDRVSDAQAFDCYLFEQVQSLLNRVTALENQAPPDTSGLQAQIDDLDQEQSTLTQSHDLLTQLVDGLSGQVDELGTQTDELDGNVGNLDTRVTALENEPDPEQPIGPLKIYDANGNELGLYAGDGEDTSSDIAIFLPLLAKRLLINPDTSSRAGHAKTLLYTQAGCQGQPYIVGDLPDFTADVFNDVLYAGSLEPNQIDESKFFVVESLDRTTINTASALSGGACNPAQHNGDVLRVRNVTLPFQFPLPTPLIVGL